MLKVSRNLVIYLYYTNNFYYLCIKVTEKYLKLLNMELKKLKTSSLADALKGMKIGETCISPDGYSHKTVIKTCAELKAQGYLFQTSTRTEVQTVTRLK